MNLPYVNQNAYDLIHIMTEYTIISLLYRLVKTCLDLLKPGGILIVGELHDSIISVVDFVSAVFENKIAKTYHIRDEVVIIKSK